MPAMAERRHVRASTLYRLIDEAGGPLLGAAGFVRYGPRTWVRNAKVPIRELVYFCPPHSYLGSHPIWGLSLDFSPHVLYGQNLAVRWHASDEGAERASAAAARVVRRTLDAAGRTVFDAVHGVADLPAAFEAIRCRVATRFDGRGADGLTPQARLAYAFTLAKLGRPEDGRQLLETFKAETNPLSRASRRQLDEAYAAAAG